MLKTLRQDIVSTFQRKDFDSLATALSSGSVRLSREEALWLYQQRDVLSLGELASKVNEIKNGSKVFYNINRHINPTNICVYDCKFCAYAKRPGEKGAYAYSIDEVVEKVRQAVASEACEVHVVGGLHPRWSLDHFCDMLRAIKKEAQHIHIKGFTAVEIFWLSKKARLSLEDTLLKLKDAGLDSMPGGGAEIFDEGIRQRITAKLDADGWLDIHRMAHSLGMKSNATMLYGHVESLEHRVDHMFRLRDLQDMTHGFNAFIPLSFQPHNNHMGITRYTFGSDDLKTIAMSRLILDNFSHIKAYWIMLGQDIAQLAIRFGANDLDGTVYEEKISHAAGGRGGMQVVAEDLDSIIQRAGKTPERRDSLYNILPYAKKPPSPLSSVQGMSSSISSALRELAGLPWFTLLNGAKAKLEDYYAIKRMVGAYRYIHELCDEELRDIRRIALEYKDKAEMETRSVTELQAGFKRSLQDIKDVVKQHRQNGMLDAALHRFALLASENLWLTLKGADAHQREDMISSLKAHAITELLPSTELCRRVDFAKRMSLREQIDVMRLCSHRAIDSRLTWLLPSDARGFFDENLFLEDLQKVSDYGLEKGMYSLEFIASQDTFITPSEYLRALALARFWLEDVSLSAPLVQLPLLSPSFAKGSLKSQHPGDKIIGILMSVAVDDLGVWHEELLDPRSLGEISCHVDCLVDYS